MSPRQRIVQESLANVRKHAAAAHVGIQIDADARQIQTTIVDDGRGFDPRRVRPGDDRLPHFGLSTMRERAESVGGTLEVTSTPGEGTRVVVRLPTHPVGVGNDNPITLRDQSHVATRERPGHHRSRPTRASIGRVARAGCRGQAVGQGVIV